MPGTEIKKPGRDGAVSAKTNPGTDGMLCFGRKRSRLTEARSLARLSRGLSTAVADPGISVRIPHPRYQGVHVFVTKPMH